MAYTQAQLATFFTNAQTGTTPNAAQSLTLQAIATQNATGQLTDAQALAQTTNLAANSTTDVSVGAYEFFLGFAPSVAGLTSLNTAYVTGGAQAGLNGENRFIAESVALATQNTTAKAAFTASYGTLSVAQATAAAYNIIIGNPAAVAAGVDVAAAVAFLSSTASVAYYTNFIKANTTLTTAADIDLAVKAAIVGEIMYIADGYNNGAGLGAYASATNALVADLADNGALTADNAAGIDLFTSYPGTSVVGQTFQLTAGIDALSSFTGGNGADTFVGNSALGVNALTSLDSIDGGGGIDTLSVAVLLPLDLTTAASGAKIVNVETANISTTGTLVADTTTWTGLTTLNANSVGGSNLTAATTTAVTATDGTLAAGTISVTGGAAVTVAASGQLAGTIGVTGAAGAVTVTTSGNYTDGGNNTVGAIAVTGGTTVTVNETSGITAAEITAAANDVSNFVETLSAVTVTGAAATTSVSVTQSAAVTKVDSNGTDGLGKIGVTNGTVIIADLNAASATKASTITSVTLGSFGASSTVNSGALTTLNLSGKGVDLTVTNGALTTPTVTTQTVNVNGLTTTGAVTLDSDITTLNLASSTAKSTIASLVAGGVTALNVSGSADVVVTASTLAALTSVNVTNTGATTLGTVLGAAVGFTGGAGAESIVIGATTKAITTGDGNDTVEIQATALGTGGSVDAGAGTADVLKMSAVQAETASAGITFETAISGFERLTLGATATSRAVNLANLDDINYVNAGAVTGGAVVSLAGATSGFTLVANAGASGGTISVALANDGSADVANVNVSAATVQTLTGLTLGGFETIAFTTDDSATTVTNIAHIVTGLTDTAAKTITVTGDAGLNLGAGFTGTALTTFDASGVTAGAVTYTTGALAAAATLTGGAGADVLNASAAVAAVTLNGGAGADTLTGSLTFANTINGGAGNDTITGGGAADVIDGGAGTDAFLASLVEQPGSGTTVSTVINLGDTALTAAAVFSATGGFLSTAAATVAAGTSTYVFSTESATNAVVVDTLLNIENVTGTTGNDYIVGSAAANVITGGLGLDVLTGGAGADTFVFAAGSSGTPSATVFDSITDYALGSDNIHGSVALTLVAEGTIGVAQAAISATGFATFNVADDTLAERIIATEAAMTAATAVAGETAVFTLGADSYVFISDGTAGIGANDVLIKLVGVTATGLTVAAGDVTVG